MPANPRFASLKRIITCWREKPLSPEQIAKLPDEEQRNLILPSTFMSWSLNQITSVRGKNLNAELFHQLAVEELSSRSGRARRTIEKISTDQIADMTDEAQGGLTGLVYRYMTPEQVQAVRTNNIKAEILNWLAEDPQKSDIAAIRKFSPNQIDGISEREKRNLEKETIAFLQQHRLLPQPPTTSPKSRQDLFPKKMG